MWFRSWGGCIWTVIQGGQEIFDLHSYRVITRRKIIKIQISKSILNHVKKMDAHDKVTSLNSRIEWESYIIITRLYEWNMKVNITKKKRGLY